VSAYGSCWLPVIVLYYLSRSKELILLLSPCFLIVSGGPKIITSVVQVILFHAVIGFSLFQSVANPRVHHQLLYHGSPAALYDFCPLLEGPTIEVKTRTLDALKRRGHTLLGADYLGTVQAVAIDLETKHLTAVSDIRKGGCAAGY